MSGLGTREKAGQVIMPRLDFRGPDPLPLARRLVSEYGVGGFIVFGGDKQTVKSAASELSSISAIPLLFGLDAERGVGQVLTDGTLFPSAMSLGAAGDEILAYEEALLIAREMKECGFNLLFAPVLDVNTNPENPIINTRAYGDDPGLVSRMGTAFARGAQDGGVLACGKHFPGHGGTGLDSHEVMPVEDRELPELESSSLIPFRNAARAGLAAIMTAHVAFPKIGKGNIPATISGNIIDGILRRDMGYDGLVITDSFHMSGINKIGDEWDNSHLALDAGCDIILDPREPVLLLDRLTDMAATGELNPKTLDRAAGRVVTAKNRLLTASAGDTQATARNGPALIECIAEGSICRLRGGNLRSRSALVAVFDVTRSDKDVSASFTETLSGAGIDCRPVHVTFDTRVDKLIAQSKDCGAVICLVYTAVGAWKKQSALPELYRSVLSELAALPLEKAFLSFGSPYVVRGFDKFDTVICAFDLITACQAAAARVLLGEIGAKGKLPVGTGF
jgi:beta-N-acetylhexosaminidase